MTVDFLSLQKGDRLQIQVDPNLMRGAKDSFSSATVIYEIHEREVQDLVHWNSEESEDEWYELALSGPDDSVTLNIWMEDGIWRAVFAVEDQEFYIPAEEAPTKLRYRGISFELTWGERCRFESLTEGDSSEGVTVVDYEGDRGAREKLHRLYLSEFEGDGVVFYPRFGVVVDVEEILLLPRVSNEEPPEAPDDGAEGDDIPPF